jgi:uncharacterized delta-60 repeat protein
MLSRILVSIFFICTSTILNGQVGELDSSFGDNGIVITDIDGSDHIYDMLIQPDKKIVVLGYSYGIPNIGGIELVTVVRYLPDGNLDSNFGEEGISVINYPHNNFDAFYAIAIQSDGDLVIAGKTNFQVEKNDVDDWVLFRLNGNGTLDSTFGYKGLVQTDFGNEFEHANDVLIQEDGKIIALGMTYEYSAGLGTCFAMVRYNINGTVDTTFGSQGFVKTFIQESAVALGGIIAPEGKIMAYGTTRNEFNVDYAIVRYKEDLCRRQSPCTF